METNQILKFFAKYIEDELGIVYSEQNFFQLQTRLEEIAVLQRLPNIEKLYEMAVAGIDGQFKILLLDIATNNETSFFRDPKVFKSIEAYLLNQFTASEAGGGKLDIWSAASATGQEALSLAMMISEWNSKQPNPIDFSIFGTDISERALDRCRKAQYSQLEVQRGLPAALMIKYFTVDAENRWTANATLTDRLKFEKMNLLGPLVFPKKFQLILCRNVLIYQTVERKIEILKKITSALAPKGYLILGSGETLIGLSNDYQYVETDGAIIYQKKD